MRQIQILPLKQLQKDKIVIIQAQVSSVVVQLLKKKQVQISYKELYRSVVFQLGCVQC